MPQVVQLAVGALSTSSASINPSYTAAFLLYVEVDHDGGYEPLRSVSLTSDVTSFLDTNTDGLYPGYSFVPSDALSLSPFTFGLDSNSFGSFLNVLEFDSGANSPSSSASPTVSNFVYLQNVASTIWPVQHNLNKFPQIITLDSSGNVVIGDVAYVDSNNIRVQFSSAIGGTAYLS